ncbi:MAG TPA: response regulator transcription factor [Terriglobia bacterium]|nr:response regulator transcription factor [Terriglobia bacterium]
MLLRSIPTLRVQSLCDFILPANAGSTVRPDVVIVDADELPFALASYLHTVRMRFPGTRILLIGTRRPDDELCRLLFEGVRGFVAYGKVEDEIFEAVTTLMSGHVWAPPQVLDRYVTMSPLLGRQGAGGRSRFTPRENEVIGLLQRRLSNKEIGGALGVSERTVRFHLENICAKLGVHDRHSIIEWARESAGCLVKGSFSCQGCMDEILNVRVEHSACQKADERPVRFKLHDLACVVEEVRDHWKAPNDELFKILLEDGSVYILRRHLMVSGADDWSLQFLRPPQHLPPS